MSDLTTENLLVDGHRIAHGRHGQGEPIVLIHGTPSSSHIWRNMVPKLVAAQYRVHLFDLLGFGASERPHDQAVDTSVSAQVAILEAMLSHWGVLKISGRLSIGRTSCTQAYRDRICIFCQSADISPWRTGPKKWQG